LASFFLKETKGRVNMPFHDFVKNDVAKFNRYMVEGYNYNRLKRTYEYIDEFIKYSCNEKTNTYLQYLGCRKLTPKEEIKIANNKTKDYEYDFAISDMYLVEYMFKYADYDEILRYHLYLPFAHIGNTITISGTKFLVMPVLADKVISIGTNGIFVNIKTAKHKFDRIFHTILRDNIITRVPIVCGSFYKNQSKKLEDTTQADTTMIHYLLSVYGYTELCKKYLGFVPRPFYGPAQSNEDEVILQSIGKAPHGYIGDKKSYIPTSICFAVPKDKMNENVTYLIGSLYYVIDHFSNVITINDLDNTLMWMKLLGEIIHSGKHGLGYIIEKMNAHFKDINSMLPPIVRDKLRSIGQEVHTTLDLIYIIFVNFNNWIMGNEVKSLYNNKVYESESYILNPITSNILKAVLDISKEELRNNKQPLDLKVVTKIMSSYFTKKAIYKLRKDQLIMTSLEYSGDHIYPKNTAMVVEQEPDPIDPKKETNSDSDKKKLHASMLTIGNILGLTKKTPTPVVRMNPYVDIDLQTGTVLPPKVGYEIIKKTEKLLNNQVEEEYVPEELLDNLQVEDMDETKYEEDVSDNDENISDEDDE
jgi:hypothetical protein